MSHIEIKSAEINVAFSEVFDTAPSLPRPLKSKYNLAYITAQGVMQETLSVAPLNEEEERFLMENDLDEVRSHNADTLEVRHVKRNLIYLRKATEFALVHNELADWYSNFLEKVAFIQTSVSALLAALTMFHLNIDMIDHSIGFVTMGLGIFKSWVAIRGYANSYTKHKAAADGFNRIKEEIMNLLTVITDMKEDEVNAELKHSTEDYEDEVTRRETERNQIVQCARKAIKTAGRVKKGVKDIATGQCLSKAADATEDSCKELLERAKAQARNLGPEESDGGPPAQKTGAVVRRLRRFYREAAQYRVAHAILEDKCRKIDSYLNLLHLVVSSMMSAVMFTSGIPYERQVSTGMSMTITILNTIQQKLQLASRAGEHQNARVAFAGIQRKLATNLMILPPAELGRHFDDLAGTWAELTQTVKPIKEHFLHGLRNKDRSPMLPLITPPLEKGRMIFTVLRLIPGGERVIVLIRKAEEKKKEAKAAAAAARAGLERVRTAAMHTKSDLEQALYSAHDTVEGARNAVDRTQSAARDAVEKTQSQARDAVEKTQSQARDAVEKTKAEALDSVEKTKAEARDAVEKTQSQARDAVEKTKKEAFDSVEKTSAEGQNAIEKTKAEAKDTIEGAQAKASASAEQSREAAQAAADGSLLTAVGAHAVQGAAAAQGAADNPETAAQTALTDRAQALDVGMDAGSKFSNLEECGLEGNETSLTRSGCSGSSNIRRKSRKPRETQTSQERRIDPKDDLLVTRSKLHEKYPMYTEEENEAYWDAECKPVPRRSRRCSKDGKPQLQESHVSHSDCDRTAELAEQGELGAEVARRQVPQASQRDRTAEPADELNSIRVDMEVPAMSGSAVDRLREPLRGTPTD